MDLEIKGEVVPLGGKGRVGPPALPQDMINRGATAQSLSTITQANFLPAEFSQLKKLLMSGPYFKRAFKIMEPVQQKLDDGTDLTREETYIATTYSPLTEEASIKRFADDLRRFDEDNKRKVYFTKFDAVKP
jgi:hypothetical protein